MTLPTKLTFFRLFATFLIVLLVYLPGAMAKLAALVVFVLAAVSDWLDGYIARRWEQISPLGVLLDPIADKVLVLGLLLVFFQRHLVPGWMVLVLVIRECLVTAIRLLAARRGVILPAGTEGKRKAFSQMLAIGMILGFLLIQDGVHAGMIPVWIAQGMSWLVIGCLWVTVILTVTSGISFLWNARSVLKHAATH